jgi:hypothetical protein
MNDEPLTPESILETHDAGEIATGWRMAMADAHRRQDEFLAAIERAKVWESAALRVAALMN